MNTTTNYQLSQWEGADRILMEDFNSDNQKIDAALKANADAVTELEEGKADAADVPRIITGSYTGTGAAGSVHYTVGAKPRLLFLAVMSSRSGAHYCGLLAGEGFYLPFYSSGGETGKTGFITFTDDGFTMNHPSSWTEYGFNRSGVTYRYVAVC